MKAHALAILKEVEMWERPNANPIQGSSNTGGKYNCLAPSLLYHLIQQSESLGGTVLGQFWEQVSRCDPKLAENVPKLEAATAPEQTSATLFEGINRDNIDFTPVYQMADEYFTHLGVAFMNPGGPQSGVGTPCSVSDIISMETDELLAVAMDTKQDEQRRQTALQGLIMNRDGATCPVTRLKLRHNPTEITTGYRPNLAHIIPNSVLNKPDTIKCLTMFAGEKARDLVMKYLNDVGNVMNLQYDAHDLYNKLAWGIEACAEDGKVKYKYRRVPFSPEIGPLSICLKDGDEIPFGQGKDGSKLGGGPLPLLCNIQLALARVLHMSEAAEIIMKMMGDADDSDIPRGYIASDDSCDILASKLSLLNELDNLKKEAPLVPTMFHFWIRKDE